MGEYPLYVAMMSKALQIPMPSYSISYTMPSAAELEEEASYYCSGERTLTQLRTLWLQLRNKFL